MTRTASVEQCRGSTQAGDCARAPRCIALRCKRPLVSRVGSFVARDIGGGRGGPQQASAASGLRPLRLATGRDPERFFLESKRGHTRDALVAEAKTVCARCPVMESCREHGLNAQEPYGIWGGLTLQERETRLRVRRRNRPRTEPTDVVFDLASG